MRVRVGVRRPPEQPLVEEGQSGHVLSEESNLDNPGHVGTIRLVLSPAVENLVAQLSRLPGVGTRTAHRLAFHLLQRPKDEALALSAAIQEVKERVRFCSECGNLTEEEVCAICRDARRDHTMICVVEQPVDLISVERTSEFRGLYHVLGGALSPLDGVEPEHLRIDELLGRVERNGVQEVVLATNPNMTAEPWTSPRRR
jgi:recombination protein RecR